MMLVMSMYVACLLVCVMRRYEYIGEPQEMMEDVQRCDKEPGPEAIIRVPWAGRCFGQQFVCRQSDLQYLLTRDVVPATV
jgi:hypothetical protein